MALKIYVVICAATFLPYGLMCFLNPELLIDSAGIQAVSAAGTTELRAMYGGLQASVGVLAISALFRPSLSAGFLVTIATVMAGLLLARLAGLLIDGGFTGYTGMALGFEVTLLSIALYFLKVSAKE